VGKDPAEDCFPERVLPYTDATLRESTDTHAAAQYAAAQYWVATIIRLLKIIGLFRKTALFKKTIFCKRDLYEPAILADCTAIIA